MKTTLQLALFLVALGTLSNAAPATRPDQTRPLSHEVKAVERFGNIVVKPGASSFTVRSMLGAPERKLASHLWAYDHFDGGTAQLKDDNCSVLLLTFQNDRVVDIQLVNHLAERVIAARIAAVNNPGTTVADTK